MQRLKFSALPSLTNTDKSVCATQTKRDGVAPSLLISLRIELLLLGRRGLLRVALRSGRSNRSRGRRGGWRRSEVGLIERRVRVLFHRVERGVELGLLEVLLDRRTDLIERRGVVRFHFDDVVAELRLHDRRHFADF